MLPEYLIISPTNKKKGFDIKREEIKILREVFEREKRDVEGNGNKSLQK